MKPNRTLIADNTQIDGADQLGASCLGGMHGRCRCIRGALIRTEEDNAANHRRDSGDHHDRIEADRSEHGRKEKNGSYRDGGARDLNDFRTALDGLRKFFDLGFQLDDFLAQFVIVHDASIPRRGRIEPESRTAGRSDLDGVRAARDL